MDGEGFAQGVSTEDGLSDGAAAKQLTNREEHIINQTEIKQSAEGIIGTSKASRCNV